MTAPRITSRFQGDTRKYQNGKITQSPQPELPRNETTSPTVRQTRSNKWSVRSRRRKDNSHSNFSSRDRKSVSLVELVADELMLVNLTPNAQVHLRGGPEEPPLLRNRHGPPRQVKRLVRRPCW